MRLLRLLCRFYMFFWHVMETWANKLLSILLADNEGKSGRYSSHPNWIRGTVSVLGLMPCSNKGLTSVSRSGVAAIPISFVSQIQWVEFVKDFSNTCYNCVKVWFRFAYMHAQTDLKLALESG